MPVGKSRGGKKADLKDDYKDILIFPYCANYSFKQSLFVFKQNLLTVIMMILSSISGTNRIRDLNSTRMLLLSLISQAHQIATNGSWTYIPQPWDPRKGWLLLFDFSSNSQGKAQLTLA